MPQEAVRRYTHIHLDEKGLGGLYICLVKLYNPCVTIRHLYNAGYISKGLEAAGFFLVFFFLGLT